ncbi:MAG: uroporphyrinogen-III C-methyltransferase [Actinomycetota bacterium]
MAGRVVLVGAGPGDPDLVTRAGLRALGSCDAVAFDDLVASELVAEAPAHADRYPVGKAAGRPVAQEEINALLIDLARAGQVVVRLKGGDPFVFGRGGEEALALAEAGVDFEIVPGVTSAVGVPGAAGIPLTHRGTSSSFAVLTGHRSADGSEADWTGLARSVDTLVLVMAVQTLGSSTARLIAAGRRPDEPAALIERGTTDRQRTIVGTLTTIAWLAARAGVCSPATLVVGEVVRVRAALAGAPPRDRRAAAPSV